MSGKIKKLINCIIRSNAKTNQALVNMTKAKLMLKGINPDSYSFFSEDDLQILEILENFARDAGIEDCIFEENLDNILISYSSKKNVEEAVDEIKSHFTGFDPKLVVFFAASCFEPALISREMRNAFDNAAVMGCSTAGEIISGKMLKDSIVAMALNSKIIADVKIEVIQDIKEENRVPEMISSFENYYGKSIREMDYKEYVGLILFDGLSFAEEKIMEKIGDHTNITFIGGSAADYMQFFSTFVYANGYSYSGSAVVALLKPAVEFDIIKTQSFCELGKKLTPTEVNKEKREVVKFNDMPAVAAYAKSLGVSVSDLEKCFMRNPVGLMIDGEPYVRSPQKIVDDRIVFYCNVSEGMELSLLKSTNIVEDTRNALNDKLQKFGYISGLISFNCILRALELESEGLTCEYVKLFENIPTIGFNSYGEQYIGHINQTATILVFK